MAKIRISNYTFLGESTAGIGTAMFVKELRLCFDLGVLPSYVLGCNEIFISHAHTDHVGELFNYLAIRALEHRNLATLFVPFQMVEPLNELIHGWEKLSGSCFDYRIIGVSPLTRVPVRKNLSVVPFPLAHAVTTYGYLVEETVSKLKAEFMELSGPEIAALKQDPSVDMFYPATRRLFAYAPDTLPEGLDSMPQEVWESEVLAIEASFLDDRKPPDKIKLGRHVRLDDIIERLPRVKGNLLLFHFSRIYSVDEVRNIVAARIPPEYADRVHLFI